jgi:hypothetical protein
VTQVFSFSFVRRAIAVALASMAALGCAATAQAAPAPVQPRAEAATLFVPTDDAVDLQINTPARSSWS